MDFSEMRRMEETHCCTQCGMPLVTKWDSDLEGYYLACGTDPHHEGYKRLTSANQTVVRGKANELLGSGAQEDLEKTLQKRSTGISLMSVKDIATSEPIPRDKLGELITWAGTLNLKPYLGHVCLYFGKPYVTIDGYYYLLHKRARSITIGCRPLNIKERQAMQIPEGDHAWLAEAWELLYKMATTGLGIVTKEEIEGKSERRPDQFRAPVVHDHPQRMAEKRAEWQLLRKLIPLEEER